MNAIRDLFNLATTGAPPAAQPDVLNPTAVKPAEEGDKAIDSEATPIHASGGDEYRTGEARKCFNHHLPGMVEKVKLDNYTRGPILIEHITKLVSDDPRILLYKDEIIAFCGGPLTTIRCRSRATGSRNAPAEPFEVRQLLDNREVVQDKTVAGRSLVSDDDLESVLIQTDYEMNELDTRRRNAATEVERRGNLARKICSSATIEVLSNLPPKKL